MLSVVNVVLKESRHVRNHTHRLWDVDRSFTWAASRRRKTVDVTMTEAETEHANGIVIETAEMTIVIMSSHRMHGMRHVEMPAAAVQDSLDTAGRTENTRTTAGMDIRIDNDMLKTGHLKKSSGGRPEEGRKFAEVVNSVHMLPIILSLKFLTHRIHPNTLVE